MSLCQRCTHAHSQVDGACIVALKTEGRDCICDKQSYVPTDPKKGHSIPDFYHFKILKEFQEVTQRVNYTITAIEGARDLPDWEFILLCWRYWLQFNVGDYFSEETTSKIKKEAQPETIRRTRQKICQPELDRLREFQEILTHTKPFSDDYWKITEEIKEFWKNSKYIPRDLEFLRAKGIKESAIFEYSIMELNDIG